MDELLKKLFEAEVLTADTKAELEQAFKKQISEAVELAKKEAADSTKAELTEQWLTERDALVEAIDSKINEFLAEEMKELKNDIEDYRDLKAEFADKAVELKAELAEELKIDLAELVDKLDAFLEIRINSEMEELREDIDHVRKIEFGREVFEAFGDMYKKRFIEEGSIEAQLREAQAKLIESKKQLDEKAKEARLLGRKIKLESVLKPLSGRQREAMEILLKNVATENLEEGYKTFIGRVVKEAVTEGKEDQSEKEKKVLAEGKSNLKQEVNEGKVVLRDGNNNQQLREEQVARDEDARSQSTVNEGLAARYQRLAGL